MSAICVFTPVVVELAWPVLSSAIASSLASIGYEVLQQKAETEQDAQADASQRNKVELDVKQSQGFEATLGEEEELALQRQQVRLVFKRAADGRLKVTAAGAGLSDEELKAAGEEAVNCFIKDYVRQKIVAQLKKDGYKLVEEKAEDGSIRIKAKSWK